MESETTSPEVNLDTWAIIELFGHSRIAGKVTNVSIAGCGFIRVQVPEHNGKPTYTRDIAPKAVYAINPCDEAAAKASLQYCSESPVIQLCAHDIERRLRESMRTHETPKLTSGEHDDVDDDDPFAAD